MNFTRRSVETAAAPAKGSKLYWDDGVRGLGLRVWASGQRSYFWSRRINKKLEYVTIGEIESVTIEDARARASERNVQAAEWKQRNFVGPAPWATPASKTLRQVIDAYKERHVRVNSRKPDRSVSEIDRQVKLLGSLADRNVAQITKAEIVRLKDQIRKKSLYGANRFVQMVRAAINWAIEAGEWAGTNPAAGIRLFEEVERERYLRAAELRRLKDALESPKTPLDLKHYVLLALFCGTRKSDTTSMRWRDIDFEKRVWNVPNPKGGKPYPVALPTEAVSILEERRAAADARAKKNELPVSQWVFPSCSSAGHVRDFKHSWQELLKTAQLDDVRQHDIRRTMASWQAAGGASLAIVGASLGHRPGSAATAVYARLDDAPIRASVQAAALAMATEMNKPPETARPQLPPAPATVKRQRMLSAPKRARRA